MAISAASFLPSPQSEGLPTFTGKFFDRFTHKRNSEPSEASTAADSNSSRAFEIADILEEGFARDTLSEYLRPFKRGTKLLRFYVTRSASKLEYSLYTDDKMASTPARSGGMDNPTAPTSSSSYPSSPASASSNGPGDRSATAQRAPPQLISSSSGTASTPCYRNHPPPREDRRSSSSTKKKGSIGGFFSSSSQATSTSESNRLNKNFVMHARVMSSDSINIYSYHPEDDLFDIDRPSFILRNEKKQNRWVLTSAVCEACCYKRRHRSCACCGQQQIVAADHAIATLSTGVFNAMQVTVPGLYTDGSRVVWCPKEGYSPLGKHLPDGTSHPHSITFRTKEPRWNNDINSLVLDFKHRVIQPSAKNFQLILAKRPEYVIMQYGKIASNVFALDFRYPLSMAQAFAIAMTASEWS